MIQTSESIVSYNGNNSTVTPYPVPFRFFDENDLTVVVNAAGVEDIQAIGVDYIVAGVDNPAGGSVRFTWAVPNSSKVIIYRMVDATQLTSYEEADAFPAKSHERALDKLTCLVQQVDRASNGSGGASGGIIFRLTDASESMAPVVKINDSMLGVDAFGDAILRTASEMLGWLGQVGTVWNDSAQRLVTKGAYPGQLGVQIDNGTIYIAHSTTPGDWIPFLIGTGIIGATDGVPHLMTPPAGDLVGTEQSQVLYNKTLESPTIHTPTGLTKSDVQLSQVDNTADLNKPISSATGAALAFKQDKSEKGISNGYPSLDGAGKIPTAQLPDSVVGASQYQGTWNAATNTPTIPAAAVGNKGWYYSVAVAGSTNINGISSWAVGDEIISNGSVWQKIANVSAVSSVNSKTGAVVLVKADISLDQVDNTSDATKNAASATLTNKTINGANNTLTVRLDADVTNNLPVNRLNNGTGASATTWWCGDNSWKQPPGTGDVNGPTGSTDGELCLYSGTTGKIIRRFSGTAGIVKASATGLISTTAQIMAVDVNKDAVISQPRITIPEWNDVVLISESSDSGNLKSILWQDVHPLPRNYLAGFVLSNNVSDTANDIDIQPGECRSDDNAANIALPTAITKRLDAAWAAGTNQGGRDTGAIIDATWHVFAIRNPTTNQGDVLLSQSLASPTMPAGFTQKRRIGSIVRLGAGGIRAFRQLGDYIQMTPAIADHAGASLGASSAFLLSLQPSVPQGMKHLCDFTLYANNNTGVGTATLTDPDVTTTGPLASVIMTGANITAYNKILIWCNTASTIYVQTGPQPGTYTFNGSCVGYWDYRGKQD